LKTAVIYIRVSTEEQAEHGFSLPEQELVCREKAKQLNATVVKVFSDEGVSGGIYDRTGLQSMFKYLKEHPTDYVIVKKIDRLARDMQVAVFAKNEIEKTGAKLISCDIGEIDTATSSGSLIYNLSSAFAEYERKVIKERTKAGKIQKARMGGIPIGFYTFGYSYDPATETISINEREAKIVREIFDLYVGQRKNLRQISKILMEKGYLTKNGSPYWHRQTIKQILLNETYVGRWRYRRRDWTTGREIPEDQQIIIPVPAIIDEETFQEAQKLVEQGTRRWREKQKNTYLLQGLFKCEDCGNRMNGVTGTWWGKRRVYYTCRRTQPEAKNKGCNPYKNIEANWIEEAIWQKVKFLLQNPKAFLKALAENEQEEREIDEELQKIDQEIDKRIKERDNIIKLLNENLLYLDDTLKQKLTRLKDEMEALYKNKEAILSKLQSKPQIDPKQFAKQAKEFLKELEKNLTLEEQKELLKMVIDEIKVKGYPPHSIHHKPEEFSITITVRTPPRKEVDGKNSR